VPTPRRRPGSYAYPQLREAAEKVWAAGGDYIDGEDVVYRGFVDLREILCTGCDCRASGGR